MAHYLTLFTFVFTFTAASFLTHRKNLSLYLALSCLLILFVGLRVNSVDYTSYEEIFLDEVTDISKLSLIHYPIFYFTNIESFFAASILVFKVFSNSFPVFIFLYAFVSLSLKFVSYYAMSSLPLLSLLAYTSLHMDKDLGQIRNGMASACFLFALYLIHQNKYIKSFILITLAMTNHLIGSIGYLFFLIKVSHIKLLCLLLFFTALMTSTFGGVSQQLVLLAGELFNLSEHSPLMRYLTTRSHEFNILGGNILMNLSFAFFLILTWDKLEEINPFNKTLIPAYIIGLSIVLLTRDYGILMMRTRDFICLPTMTTILPSCVYVLPRRLQATGFFALSLLLLLYLVIHLFDRAPYEVVLLNY